MRPQFPAAYGLFHTVLEGTAADVARRLAAGDDANARSDDGRTPLAFAVRSARGLPKADLLFAAGARVDTWDDLGMQPVHWATHSVYHEDVTCLAWLLDRGADPSASVRPSKGIQFYSLSKSVQFYAVGSTPLHIAAHGASVVATRLLIERRADVNARAADGSAALHVAAQQYRVYKRLIRALLDGGADADAADSGGRTPLHVLAGGHGRYRKGAIRLLRHRNARLDAHDANGLRPADLVPDGLPATAAILRLLEVPPDRPAAG